MGFRFKLPFRGFLLIIFLLFAGILAFVVVTWPKSPEASLELARGAISKAKNEGSASYASEHMDNAQKFYDDAMTCWKEENKKFWFRRDYNKIEELAHQAKFNASLAAAVGSENFSAISVRLVELLTQLNDDCNYFDSTLRSIPLDEHIMKLAVKGKHLLAESQIAFDRDDINLSIRKAEEGNEAVTEAINKATDFVKAYFAGYDMWIKQYQNVLSESRSQGSYAIVVDKFGRKCILFHKGKQLASYDVEFGKNWIRKKQYQGDKATPEGRYKILKKKNKSNTRYHLALLLDYPNADDVKNFQELKKKGAIGARTEIGGLIEIHGHGGQGANWTDGCVALENDDMEKLFAKVPLNTAVLIVGSLRKYDDIFGR